MHSTHKMSSSSKRSRSAQDESWSSESIDTSDGGSDGEKRKKVTEKKEKKRPRSVEIESSSSSSSSSSSTSTDEDVDEKIPPIRSRTPDLHSTPPRLVLRNPALGAAREPPPAPEKRPRQTEERHRPVPFISDEHPLSIYEAQPEGGGSGPAVTRVRTLRRRVDRRGKSSYSPVKIPLRLSKDVVEIDVVIRATRDYWEKLEAKTKGIIPVRDRLLGVVENKIAQVAGEPDAKRRRLSASLLLDLPERRSAQKFARPILQNKGIAAAASIFDGSDGSKPADAKRMVAIAEVFATCIFPAIFYFNEDRRSERFALVSKVRRFCKFCKFLQKF